MSNSHKVVDLPVADDPAAQERSERMLLDAQRLYELGFDLIPLWGVRTLPSGKRQCCCPAGAKCKSPGKHPVEQAWQERPKFEWMDIAGWAEDPSALGDNRITPKTVLNLGARMGVRSGCFALDPDVKNGKDGVADLEALARPHGGLPATRIHSTPNAPGQHLFWRIPDGLDFTITNSSGDLPNSIDVRGHGGFVVIWGETPDGEYVPSAEDPIAEPPEWLIDIIRPKVPAAEVDKVPSVPYVDLPLACKAAADKYVASVVAGETARLDAMRQAAVTWGSSPYDGEPWDKTTYEVCCNLVELAQSDWANFGVPDVVDILKGHAPTDAGFTMQDVAGKLASAQRKVRGKARAMPDTVNPALRFEALAYFAPDPETGEVDTEVSWEPMPWTQGGMVKRTLRLAAGRIAYDPERRTWYEQGPSGLWRAGDADIPAAWAHRAVEAARQVEMDQYEEEKQDKFRSYLNEAATTTYTTAVATELRRLARDHGIDVSASRFDADPFLVAFANGVVDIRTGELRAIRPDDFIATSSPYNYNPAAKRSDFEAFLASAQPDPLVRKCLQRAFGYSLTGSTKERVAFWHFAPVGTNGRSTLFNMLAPALGGYYGAANSRVLTKQQRNINGAIGQDLIDLDGKRMLVTNETVEGAQVSDDYKNIVSGDLRADRPHAQANRQHRTIGKFHIPTNHLPHVTPDKATRLRTVLFTWGVSFEGREDRFLEEKLMAEAEGILAWMIQGATEWYADLVKVGTGLAIPASMIAARDEWFSQEDAVSGWLEECALDARQMPKKEWATVAELYDSFCRWTTKKRVPPMSDTAFGRRLNALGFPSDKVRRGSATPWARPLELRRDDLGFTL